MRLAYRLRRAPPLSPPSPRLNAPHREAVCLRHDVDGKASPAAHLSADATVAPHVGDRGVGLAGEAHSAAAAAAFTKKPSGGCNLVWAQLETGWLEGCWGMAGTAGQGALGRVSAQGLGSGQLVVRASTLWGGRPCRHELAALWTALMSAGSAPVNGCAMKHVYCCGMLSPSHPPPPVLHACACGTAGNHARNSSAAACPATGGRCNFQALPKAEATATAGSSKGAALPGLVQFTRPALCEYLRAAAAGGGWLAAAGGRQTGKSGGGPTRGRSAMALAPSRCARPSH